MITRTAIMLNDEVYVGDEFARHDSVILGMISIGVDPVGGIQGFVDEKGKFYDRHDAAKHAFECSQLIDKKCPDIIVSEDLW